MQTQHCASYQGVNLASSQLKPGQTTHSPTRPRNVAGYYWNFREGGFSQKQLEECIITVILTQLTESLSADNICDSPVISPLPAIKITGRRPH